MAIPIISSSEVQSGRTIADAVWVTCRPYVKSFSCHDALPEHCFKELQQQAEQKLRNADAIILTSVSIVPVDIERREVFAFLIGRAIRYE